MRHLDVFMRLGAFAALAGALLLAPGHAHAEPDALDRFTAVVDELSELAEGSEAACDALVTTLDDHVTSNERRIRRLAVKASAQMDGADTAAMADMRKRLEASMGRYHSATERCPAAGAVIDRFMAVAAPGNAAEAPVTACEPTPDDRRCTAPEGHGYAPERPLEWPIAMAGADRLWFGRLQCADGSLATTRRVGHIGQAPVASTSPPAHDPVLDVVDEWEVACGEESVTLYVNTYRCGSLCAPHGFSIAAEPDASDE